MQRIGRQSQFSFRASAHVLGQGHLAMFSPSKSQRVKGAKLRASNKRQGRA